MPTGESLHVIGEEGASRAKLWLEKTGRVEVNFSRYEVGEAPFLTFKDVTNRTYSYDLGGILRLDSGKVSFLGEVKKVTSEAGQGTMYREYLAKCYRTSVQSSLPFHFVWITWHPFSVTTWMKLCTAEEVKSAMIDRKEQYCDSFEIDDGLCERVAERLWLIVLSERQESLAMSDSMLGTLKKALVEGVAT